MSDEAEYGDFIVKRLELIWGKGFMSPGGAAEVRRLFEGIDLHGLSALDIGCGTGGPALLLRSELGADSVVGVDVSPTALAVAERRAREAGLGEHVTFRAVVPGKLPLADDSFDVVHSNAAFCHIHDKDLLLSEIFRVLRPGGRLIANDWFLGDLGVRAKLDEFRNVVDWTADPKPREYWVSTLERVGFSDVRTVDRSDWCGAEVAKDQTKLRGPMRESAIALLGAERYDKWMQIWDGLVSVMGSKALRVTDMFGTKPAKR